MVGQRIKAYLESHGIRHVFLAHKSGIPVRTLHLILSGRRKLEAIEYYKICKALEVDMLTFIADEESEV